MNGSHQTCLIDEIKWYKRIRATEIYNECFLLKPFQSISNICHCHMMLAIKMVMEILLSVTVLKFFLASLEYRGCLAMYFNGGTMWPFFIVLL